MKEPSAGAEFLQSANPDSGYETIVSKIGIISGRDWSVRGVGNCNCMAVCSVRSADTRYMESLVYG